MTFRAASGQLNLNPPAGARLTGFAARLNPSVGTHDPLLGRALLLDDGDNRLLWISCDLLGFSTATDRALRERAAERLGIESDHVLVSCSHTHSGPSSMPLRGSFGEVNQTWLAGVVDRLVDLAGSLKNKLTPVKMSAASTSLRGLGYNRQDESQPIDQRLLAVSFQSENGQAMGTLLNYALHPVVLGEINLLYSADYVGAFTAAVEKKLGGQALFVQGSAGDVDPVVYRDLGRHAGTFAIAQQMGRLLADAAISALASVSPKNHVRISVAQRAVDVPLDPAPSLEELARTKKELLKNRGDASGIPDTDQGKWALSELAWAEELEQAIKEKKVPTTVAATMTAARIGGLYVVAAPFEIYSQIGLEARRQLEPRPVLFAGYTNGLIGYAPTARAKQQGGYGPACSHRFFPELLTALGMDAEQTLVGNAVELVKSLD